MKWIFIEFGSFQIKAMLCSIEQSRLAIEDIVYWPTQEGFLNGLGMPQAEAWIQIQQGLEQLGWITNEAFAVSTALPSSYLEARYLRFPFSSSRKIEKVLGFELEGNIPFDLDELFLRFQVIKGAGVQDVSPQHLVFAQAFKKESIHFFETQLRQFQISVPSFSVDSLVTAAFVPYLTPSPCSAIFHLGNKRSYFSLFQENTNLLATKNFWWGADRLICQLSESMNLPEERCRELLEKQASFDVDKDSQSIHIKMTETLEFGLNELMDEFRQYLKSLQQQGLVFESHLPVYLTGAPARIKGLRGRLEQRFSREFGMEFRDFPFGLFRDKVDGLEKIEAYPSASNLFAQALLQLRQNRARVPYFSESSFALQQNLKQLQSFSYEALRKVGLILIAPFIYLIVSLTLGGAEKNRIYEELDSYLSRFQIEREESENLEDLNKRLRKELIQYRKQADALGEDDNSPLITVQEISEAIPRRYRMKVTELLVNESKVLMTAETVGLLATDQILTELQKAFPDAKKGIVEDCKEPTGCKRFKVEFSRGQPS